MENHTIAYFDSSHDLPEEIVMAAGFTPHKILGDVHRSTNPADKYLFQTFCPLARSILTEALENPNKWAGIIVAHGCDATNRQYDIWKFHVETPFIYWVNTPLKDDETARKFFRGELEAFIESLEKQFNVKITNEKIKESIVLSNKIKKILQDLSKLRFMKNVPNREYFETVKIAVEDEKNAVLEKLKNKLEEWNKLPEFPLDMKKILLTGSDVTYPEWMDVLEESKMRVVRDDLSIGERYYATIIPENEDPIESLIDYHFNIPRAATKHTPDKRLDYLLSVLNETKLDGIVSQNIKFCEPYAIDSVFTQNALKDKGYSIIHVERDYTGQIDEQLKNRLEAFREIL